MSDYTERAKIEGHPFPCFVDEQGDWVYFEVDHKHPDCKAWFVFTDTTVAGPYRTRKEAIASVGATKCQKCKHCLCLWIATDPETGVLYHIAQRDEVEWKGYSQCLPDGSPRKVE